MTVLDARIVRPLAGLVLLGMPLACAKAPPADPAPSAAAPPSSDAASAAAPAPTSVSEEPEKPSARPAEWGYAGALDPSHWAQLNPAYAACATGVMQSPVDIPSKSAKPGSAFRFSYGNARISVAHHEHVEDIVDNGHTIQVTVEEGSTLSTAKGTYALKQFHFHTPSENRIDGKSFPMEAHFVHQSEQGDFAVVAVLFQEGQKNESLQKLIDHFPANQGETVAVKDTVDLTVHVPTSAETFHFLGSFTTPPCTENVEWIVYKTPASATKAQLQAFASKLGSNNRPTQDFRSRALSVNQLQGGSR